MSAAFDLRPGDRILQFAAYTFDQGIEQILTALTVGGTLVMRGPDVWPPEDFPRVIASYGLNSVNLPPAYLTQVLREWAQSQIPLPEGQLRTIISGGDVLSAESLHLWQSTPARSARLLNAYGPTETTVTALVCDVPPDWFAALCRSVNRWQAAPPTSWTGTATSCRMASPVSCCWAAPASRAAISPGRS